MGSVMVLIRADNAEIIKFLPPSFVRSEKGELQYDCEIAILDTRDVWYKSDLIAFM